MIGQSFGLPFLVPLAVEELEKDRLVEGDFYPGDLLENVLTIKPQSWKERPDLRDRLHADTEDYERACDVADSTAQRMTYNSLAASQRPILHQWKRER